MHLGAVAASACVIGRKNLVQHRVVGIKVHLCHGLQISLVAVRGGLDAVGEAERRSGVSAAVANMPRDNQFGVGIDGRPRPHVASAFRSGLGELDVLILGVAERPNLVALDSFGGDVADLLVMKGRAS